MRILFGLFILAAGVSTTFAAEPVTDFAGFYDFGLGEPPAESRVVHIVDAEEWKKFLAHIPTKVPGETTRIDTVNDNPVLTARIDWRKQMAIAIVSGDEIPTIESVAATDAPRPKRVIVVEYSTAEDFSARPVGWGTFAVKITPRSEGKIVARRVKAKPFE